MKNFYILLLSCLTMVTGLHADTGRFTQQQLDKGKMLVNNLMAAAKNKSTLHKNEALRRMSPAPVTPDSGYEYGWNADTFTWTDSVVAKAFTWSSNGTLTDSLLLQYLVSGAYVNLYKYVYTYDGNGNMLTQQIMVEDQPYYFITYIYDGNNNLLTTTTQAWNGSGYGNAYYETRTYDVHNNLLTDTNLTWSTSAYSAGSVDVYSYDANNNKLTDTSSTIANFIYTYNLAITNTYDAHHNKLSIYAQVWLSGAFQHGATDTFAYDVNNNLISQYEIGSNGLDINSYRDTMIYDGNNNQLSFTSQRYDGVSTWVNYEESLMDYDGNSNQTRRHVIDWNGSAWAVNITDVKSPFDSQNRELYSVQLDFNQAGDSISQTGTDSVVYYYGGLPAAVKSYSAPAMQLYPNPASGNLIITANNLTGNATLEVFDNAGRLVLQKLVAASTRIDLNVENLQTGAYTLRLQSQQGSVVEQFVKE